VQDLDELTRHARRFGDDSSGQRSEARGPCGDFCIYPPWFRGESQSHLVKVPAYRTVVRIRSLFAARARYLMESFARVVELVKGLLSAPSTLEPAIDQHLYHHCLIRPAR
jgi:hypothetical protein